MKRLILLLASGSSILSLLAGVALGQSLFDPEVVDHVVVPPEWAGTVERRIVVGDVTGDGGPEGIAIRDGELFLQYGLPVHNAAFGLSIPALDVDYLPPGAVGETGRILVLDTQGLRVLGDYQGGAFATDLRIASAWAGAQSVRAVDVDGDGLLDGLGVGSAGELLLDDDIGTPSTLHTLPVPAAVSGTILGYAPLTWSATVGRAVAVVTTGGFVVVDLQGTPVHHVAAPLAHASLAVVTEEGSDDRVAVAYDQGQTCFLVTFSAAEGLEFLFPLAAAQEVCLDAARVNDDGADDLLVLGSQQGTALVLFNQHPLDPAGPTFDNALGAGEAIDLSADPQASGCGAGVLADLTGDGDLDLYVHLPGDAAFALVENQAVVHGDLQVEVEGGTYVVYVGDESELSLDVAIPTALAFTPTHLGVTVWQQPNAAGGGETSESALYSRSHAITGNAMSITIPLPEEQLYTPNVYYVELRPVAISAGLLVATGVNTVTCFTTPEGLMNDLEQSFGPGTWLRVFVVENEEETELSELQLTDRTLAPKEVDSDKIPVICLPPNPFG